MPLSLFPFQETGAAFLASRERAGLFDEPGVGKTAQAIRALDLRGAIRGIVVAPGAKMAGVMQLVRTAAAVDPQIGPFLRDTGLGNDPALIRKLANRVAAQARGRK